MNIDNHYKRVVETLKLLAASYKEQETYLPDYADIPTDVTSSFEDVFLLLPNLIEEGLFSNKSVAWILRTYNKMQWCLSNIELDDFSSSDWDEVREFSKKTLLSMGELPDKPDVGYI